MFEVAYNFLGTSSQFICAIIEPASDTSSFSTTLLSEITRAIASANCGLAPPLCISWARVLVLKGQHITKKGAIFRKRDFEDLGGDAGKQLSLPSQRLVPFFCAFYYYLLICYASSEWILLWLQ